MYLILVTYALVTLYPFLWTVSASFKTYAEITGGVGLLPAAPTLANYIKLFLVDPLFPRWVVNSFGIAIVGTCINVVLNSMAGYSLARVSFRGRNAVFYALLAAMAIPGQVLLIPNYMLIHRQGRQDSYGATLLPGAVTLSYIFFMRQYFMNFSKEVEEAASIDGLSRYGTFFRISIPLARPAIATQATFVFLSFWNEFTRPMLYLKREALFTLPLGIQRSQSKYAGITQWNEVLTASVVSILPIVVIYIILNRYLMQGGRQEGGKEGAGVKLTRTSQAVYGKNWVSSHRICEMSYRSARCSGSQPAPRFH